MATTYDPKVIEPKWQARWAAEKAFSATDDYTKPKFYGLVEFPYPSGAGMHVGHIKAYTSLEVISRKRRMEGYNVLFTPSRPTPIPTSSPSRTWSTSRTR